MKPNLKFWCPESRVRQGLKLSHPSNPSEVLGHFISIFPLGSPHSHQEGKGAWWEMSWLNLTLQASLILALLHSPDNPTDNGHFSVLQISSAKFQIPPHRAFAHAASMVCKGFPISLHLVYPYSSSRGQLKCNFFQEAFSHSPDKLQAPKYHILYILFLAPITICKCVLM